MIIICNHRSSAYHLIQFVYTYDYFAFVITKPLFIQPQSKTLERIIPEVSRLIIADIHCRSLIYNCSLRVRVSNTMLHVRTVSIIRNSTRHIIIRNMFIRKHFFFFFYSRFNHFRGNQLFVFFLPDSYTCRRRHRGNPGVFPLVFDKTARIFPPRSTRHHNLIPPASACMPSRHVENSSRCHVFSCS